MIHLRRPHVIAIGLLVLTGLTTITLANPQTPVNVGPPQGPNTAAEALRLEGLLIAGVKTPFCEFTDGVGPALVTGIGLLSTAIAAAMYMTGDQQGSNVLKAAVLGGMVVALAPSVAILLFGGGC